MSRATTNESAVDFDALNNAASRRLQPLFRKLLPDGKLSGNEWVMRDSTASVSSLERIRMDIRNGIWTDASVGIRGSGATDFVAHILDCPKLIAASKIADELCLDLDSFKRISPTSTNAIRRGGFGEASAPSITDVKQPEAGGFSLTMVPPLPLFPPVPQGASYPVANLGDRLGSAAAAIVRKNGVAEAIAGQAVLGAAALAVQGHADVVLPHGHVSPCSLYLLSIASSGDRKSTADREVLASVYAYQEALLRQHQDEIVIWQALDGTWACEHKRILRDRQLNADMRRDELRALGKRPSRPLHPLLMLADLTIEGLYKNWADSRPSLGIFTSEGGQFLSGHVMSSDRKIKNSADLSELWDGRSINRVRAGDGITQLQGRRLSCHLLVQPDIAKALLSDRAIRDQGLLSRLLVAAPASLAGSRLFRDADPADVAAIKAYNDHLATLLRCEPTTLDGRNTLTPRSLLLSDEATRVWRDFYNAVERRCCDDLSTVVDVASKAAEQAARIAAVITLHDDLSAQEIDAEVMRNAVGLANWYLGEAVRLTQASVTDAKLMRAETMLAWLQKRNMREVEFIEILQRGPGPLRTKRVADECVATLEAHGWIEEVCSRPRRFLVWNG